MSRELNYEFPIVSINKEEYDAIEEWIEKHKADIAEKKLYIFGAGIRGNLMLKLLEEAAVRVSGFCDNGIKKQGAYVKEYKIFAPEEILDDLQKNYILISPENSDEIEKMLCQKGYVKDKNYSVITNNIYAKYQKEFFREGEIDYILFGDCYFTELDIEDMRDKTMGQLAAGELGKKNTKVLSIHGMCIPGFYHLMSMQIKLGIIPRSAAFIVNIPFCNGIQTKLPQSQHAKLLRSIRKDMPFYDEEFDQYVLLAEKRSRNINSESFSSQKVRKDMDGDYVEKLLTRNRYMYEFKEDNENIIYLKKMIELLQKYNIKPVPFIPALNYHTGIEYFGQDFLDRYTEICEDIQECVKQYEVEILNMSFMLEKEYYSGPRMTKFPNDRGKEKEISLLCNSMRI